MQYAYETKQGYSEISKQLENITRRRLFLITFYFGSAAFISSFGFIYPNDGFLKFIHVLYVSVG